jgi:hypothetical protein
MDRSERFNSRNGLHDNIILDLSCLYSYTKKGKRLTPKRATEKWLLANNIELYNKIMNFTSEEKDIEFVERIRLIERGLKKRPLCETCKEKPVSRVGILYCSKSCAIKSLKTQEKIDTTCKILYGKRFNVKKRKSQYNIGEHHTQKSIKNLKDLENKDFMLDLIENNHWSYIANHFGLTTKSHSSVYKFLRKHNFEPKISSGYSHQERKIFEFTKSLDCDIIANTKSIIPPYELDIFSKKYSLAIEYNGLFWHSYNQKETEEQINYHVNKTNLCEKNGIKLLHFFEHEWLYKQEIVKSMISSKFGVYKQVYDARECDIKEIDTQIYKDFCEKNHIQGYCQAKIKLGAFHRKSNFLISIMSLSIPKFQSNKSDYLEIVRFCSLLNSKVRGIFSKFISYLNRQYGFKNLISFGNRRWCNIHQNVYLKNGFEIEKIIAPNYFYYNNKNYDFISRYKARKYKLEKMFETFDSSLSESEIMFANNYRRVWDCGSIKFIKGKEK